MKDFFENTGYSVVGAANSWQALALLVKSPIRLIVGGELLCGADGMELVQRIKDLKPDVPLVLCSRTLPNSMRGVDAFVSADEPSSNFFIVVKGLLDRLARGNGRSRPEAA
jgi:DNA-binding NtrC family response regulator